MRFSPGGIRQFVRHTLGCSCPDDVFEHIEQGASHTSLIGTPVTYRILVGNRLLVYLWEPDDINSLTRDLPVVVERGRRERDNRGYNRFRLVILTRWPEQWGKTAEDLFRTATGDDTRLHLHLVDAGEALAALR